MLTSIVASTSWYHSLSYEAYTSLVLAYAQGWRRNKASALLREGVKVHTTVAYAQGQ